MKTQKLRSKLSLRKSTIASLEQKQLDHVRGGTLPTEMCTLQKGCIPTRYTCETCAPYC
jgi:natural product precursor